MDPFRRLRRTAEFGSGTVIPGYDHPSGPPGRRRLGNVVDNPVDGRDDLRAGIVVPTGIFGVAAYRPEERSAELTQALNDIFWLWFIGIVGTIIVQNVTLAVAAFVDATDPPTFPRWYGYLNLWVATLPLPGCVVVVFNEGPLAWNGIFAFYIPGLVLLVWIFATTAVMLKSIRAQQAQLA